MGNSNELAGENFPPKGRSFTMIWHYEGRDIPIEVFAPSEEEEDHFIEVMAQWLWKNRHLAKVLDKTPTPPHDAPD